MNERIDSDLAIQAGIILDALERLRSSGLSGIWEMRKLHNSFSPPEIT
jgi:hypothetical protein